MFHDDIISSNRFLLRHLFTLLIIGAFLTGCARESDISFAPEIKAAVTCVVPAAHSYTWQAGTVVFADNQGNVLGYAHYSMNQDEMSKGFRGPMPVVIVCNSDNIILSTTLLPHQDDKKYIKKVESAGLFEEWCGFGAQEAATLPVDSITGATFSSNGIIASVKTILKNRNKPTSKEL